MKLKPGLLLLLFLLYFGSKCDGREILLLISCPQHREQSCQSLSDNLWQQRQQISELEAIPADYGYVIKVHIMHELFNYWTLLDALPHLRGQTRLLNANTDWIIWCQHNTHVSSLRALLDQLGQRDAHELAYYGHALYDAEATIVHHFAHYKNPTWFPYPMLSAGVIFTGALLRSLAELVAVNALNATRHSEFAIDAAHELGRFIFDNLAPPVPNDDDEGNGVDGRRNSKGSSIDKDDDKELLQGKIILKSAAFICPSASLSPTWSPASSETPPGARKTTTAKDASNVPEIESETEPELASKPVSCVLHAKSETATGNTEHCVSCDL